MVLHVHVQIDFTCSNVSNGATMEKKFMEQKKSINNYEKSRAILAMR